MTIYVKSPEMVLLELGAGQVSSLSETIPYKTFEVWIGKMRNSCRSENFTTYYFLAQRDGENTINGWCDKFFDPRNIVKLENMEEARRIFKDCLAKAKKEGFTAVNPLIQGRVRRRPSIRGYEGLDLKGVKQILQYVTPRGLPSFDLSIYSLSPGEEHPLDCNVRFSASRASMDVFVMPEAPDKPARIHDRPRHIPINVFNHEEALVYLIAHGVRHIWQLKHFKGHRVWGSKSRFSDKDACAYGIHMLRCWRRGDESGGEQMRAILRHRKVSPS